MYKDVVSHKDLVPFFVISSLLSKADQHHFLVRIHALVHRSSFVLIRRSSPRKTRPV